MCIYIYIIQSKRLRTTWSVDDEHFVRLSVSSLINRGRHSHILCVLWFHRIRLKFKISQIWEFIIRGNRVICSASEIVRGAVKIVLLVSNDRILDLFQIYHPTEEVLMTT